MHINPSSWKTNVGSSGVQDCAQLHKEFNGSLDFMRLYHKPKLGNEEILIVTLFTSHHQQGGSLD